MRSGLVRRWLDLSHKDQHAGAKSGRGLNQLLGLAVRPLYRAYEGRLSREIPPYPVPQTTASFLTGIGGTPSRAAGPIPVNSIPSVGAGSMMCSTGGGSLRFPP